MQFELTFDVNMPKIVSLPDHVSPEANNRNERDFRLRAVPLENLKLRENTIIVYMSDNGHSEETGNRIRVDNHKSGHPKGHFYGASGGGFTGKWIGHKGNFLEGGIRVPAIISYPSKLPKGEVRNQAITAMDWFPTVTELCGVKPKASHPKLDGSSLGPIIASANAPSSNEIMHWQWHTGWAIRKGNWKLIGRGSKASFLGNLNDTQPERKNYRSEKNALVREMTELHHAWVEKVKPK